MNRLSHLLLFFLLSNLSYGQKSFEGLIKFSTNIKLLKNAPSVYNDLPEVYGDSLIMYYSANGDFKRIHLNSADFGNGTQDFNAKNGIIIFTKNNGEKDTLNVVKNLLELKRKTKINNEKIMDRDCECWEYMTLDQDGDYAILNYCFNLNTPKIDPSLYLMYQDFFLYDFYELSKRPYLKFSLETKYFILTYTADRLIEGKLSN
ncbi:hypothetical protein [Flavobacterium sp.]|uniref:hypothetical protein n=1 Tax=Flavobacterium sp. TaxID=239 RepID=UPI002B4B6BE8|nr:hypothetical protein [Flavobacterium sp.]HLP65085.1 hypothetical protein [Flavobacterium sp.]